MRNIFRIFIDDLKLGTQSIIGIIVLVGLILVPAMYAWFNDLASWDPYGNTQGVKIAVANSDDGYKGDLLPVSVNVGNNVESSLRANKSFDWIFVDEETAIEGVKSGKYYSAIVIPNSFSQDMMSLFSTDVKHSDILYYTNEKINPIAPRLTDAGASHLQEEIREEFTSTVVEIGVSTLSDLSKYVDSDNFKNYTGRLETALDNAIADTDNMGGQLRALAKIVASTNSLVKTSSQMLADSGVSSDAVTEASTKAQSELDTIPARLQEITDTTGEAISANAAAFEAVEKSANEAFDDLKKSAEEASQNTGVLATQIGESATAYGQIASAIDDLARISSLDDASKAKLAALANDAHDTSKSLSKASDSLHELSKAEASRVESDIEPARQQALADIDDAKNKIKNLEAEYQEQVNNTIEQLNTALGNISDTSSDFANKLDNTVSNMSGATDSLGATLSDSESLLYNVAGQMDQASSELRDAKTQLDEALASGNNEKIKKIIGDNGSYLASYLAAPVEMDRHAVFAIANNGSMMMPFYTLLSLWVGAVLLVAMLECRLGEKRADAYKAMGIKFKDHQEYFGRFGIFSLIVLCQSLVVSLGDLIFIGIQCEHLALFVLSCVIISQAFSFFTYTLTLSFGNVGKALSVILLVVQIAGCGGIFPIEMSGGIFEVLYPFLPFVYGLRALQACIGGIYGTELVMSVAHIVVSMTSIALVLGLILRKPVIKLNRFSHHQLEKTKLM